MRMLFLGLSPVEDPWPVLAVKRTSKRSGREAKLAPAAQRTGD